MALRQNVRQQVSHGIAVSSWSVHNDGWCDGANTSAPVRRKCQNLIHRSSRFSNSSPAPLYASDLYACDMPVNRTQLRRCIVRLYLRYTKKITDCIYESKNYAQLCPISAYKGSRNKTPAIRIISNFELPFTGFGTSLIVDLKIIRNQNEANSQTNPQTRI